MLIRHQKTMTMGLLLGVTFFGVLALILSPIFGEGRNGLEYSDALFNKLAKGSSYFIPQLSADLKGVENQEIAVTVKMENAGQADKAVKILSKAAPDTTSQGVELRSEGILQELLGEVLEDSSAMYYNKGSEISEKYGMDEKEVMSTWWGSSEPGRSRNSRKARELNKSNIILEVMKKGIEPAFNFYNIEPQKVCG